MDLKSNFIKTSFNPQLASNLPVWTEHIQSTAQCTAIPRPESHRLLAQHNTTQGTVFQKRQCLPRLKTVPRMRGRIQTALRLIDPQRSNATHNSRILWLYLHVSGTPVLGVALFLTNLSELPSQSRNPSDNTLQSPAKNQEREQGYSPSSHPNHPSLGTVMKPMTHGWRLIQDQ